jgi:predicted acetyltransferase
MELSLLSPIARLEESYRKMMREYSALAEPPIPFPLRYPYDDFAALLKNLADQESGIGVPEGFVSSSTYWLVGDESTILGVSNLRHSLTERLRIEGGHIGYGVRPSQRGKGYGHSMLRLTLERAKLRNIDPVMLSCNRDNMASRSIIERAGGKFEDETFVKAYGGVVRRYWIEDY